MAIELNDDINEENSWTLNSDISNTTDNIKQSISPILINQIKESADLWDEKSISIYLKHIEDIFLEKYNSINDKNEKKEFIKNNLENFEEIYYSFIDDKKDENNNILKRWNKALYWNIWLFYEKIWQYPEAVSSYVDWIQFSEWLYTLYWKIWEIYLENKINIKLLIKSNLEIAEDNYSLLLKLSEINKDSENYVLALEKLWDINFKKNNNNIKITEDYYINSLNNWVENKSLDKNQIERICLKILKVSENQQTIQNILQNLVNINNNHLLTVAMYYEENWYIEYAFYNYLLAYQEKWEKQIVNSPDALIMFIETIIKNKTISDTENYFKKIWIDDIEILEDDEILEEIKYQEKLQNQEIEIKKQILSRIIKTIEKNKPLLKSDISILFEMCIWNDFYNNDISGKIDYYITNYNNYYHNMDIYLYTIFNNIIQFDWNKENELIKNILKKIYNKKELTNEDISVIKQIIKLSNNNKSWENNFLYTDKLNDIWNKNNS